MKVLETVDVQDEVFSRRIEGLQTWARLLHYINAKQGSAAAPPSNAFIAFPLQPLPFPSLPFPSLPFPSLPFSSFPFPSLCSSLHHLRMARIFATSREMGFPVSSVLQHGSLHGMQRMEQCASHGITLTLPFHVY